MNSRLTTFCGWPLWLFAFSTTTVAARENAPKPLDTAKEIEQVKTDVCVHLERLLQFKGNPDFQKVGFGRGGPYYKWLAEVEALRDAQPKGINQPIPLEIRAAPGGLISLGMEYLHGPDGTKDTRLMLSELKETLRYTSYLSRKRSERVARSLKSPRVWKDRTGKYSVEATLVSFIGGRVTLRKADGDRVVVPVEKLSAVDRSLIKTAFPELPTSPRSRPAAQPGAPARP